MLYKLCGDNTFYLLISETYAKITEIFIKRYNIVITNNLFKKDWTKPTLKMAGTTQKVFYRRCIRVGNSSGALLPKALLGSDVRVVVIKPPVKIKKNTMSILEPVLEHILGVYLITRAEKKIELLAISTNINRHIEKGIYKIDIVPLNVLKKSIKDKSTTRENIKKAKVVINAKLLNEIKKGL